MSPNPPQTLSVKRKRHEAPVDSLVVERNEKRLKSVSVSLKEQLTTTSVVREETRVEGNAQDGLVRWRLKRSTTSVSTQSVTSPTTETPRRFHLDRTAEKPILFEARPTNGGASTAEDQLGNASAPEAKRPKPVTDIFEEISRPRKRPGASTALLPPAAQQSRSVKAEPSEEVLRQFEKFSNEVELQETASKSPSKSRFKPKAPKLRFRDRHPEQTATLATKDPDAMEIDDSDYVYDTYVREIVMPDADGKVPEPQGTVGIIVISEEDQDWWNGDDESEKEFDTDDDDENAEDYYANDYPEDELSEDDEYDRDPYKYVEDGEYDVDGEARSDVEEDDEEPFSQTVPVKSAGYWGRAGE